MLHANCAIQHLDIIEGEKNHLININAFVQHKTSIFVNYFNKHHLSSSNLPNFIVRFDKITIWANDTTLVHFGS